MQNVIEFPHAASRGPRSVAAGHAPVAAATAAVTHAQAVRSIGNMIAALSRTLDQIRMLCEMLPDGPIREQLKAERTRLTAGLFNARQTAARLSAALAPALPSEAADQPLALTH
jgi:hypothetical protein